VQRLSSPIGTPVKIDTGSFIVLCWAIFLLFILITIFAVKRTAEVARGWSWSLLLFLAAVAGILFFNGVPRLSAYLTKMPFWRQTLASGLSADVIVFSGLVIALAGRATLGRNWNLNPGLKERHELVERGPYAYVRHPMYSGLLLMFLGAAVWFGTGAGFILLLLCFAGTWLKLRKEEMLLAAHFGGSYSSYKNRVKALIPYVF
jgi:protein-S-isoprenylcysteine O-methyltransferase Ste14